MRARNIFIIDDDQEFRKQVRTALGTVYRCTEVADELQFREKFRPYTYDLVILDMRLKTGREGLDLLKEIRAFDDLQPVIMVSAYGDTDATLDAIESGALMFLHKQEYTPTLIARLVETLIQQGRIQRRVATLEDRLHQESLTGFIGTSPAIRRAEQLIRKAAGEPESWVVVIGEMGCGRTLTAQIVHDLNRQRSEAPLVCANLLGLNETEVHLALFGSGIFNGRPRTKGWLEQANGGVLFLKDSETLSAKNRELLAICLKKRALEIGNDNIKIPLDMQLIAVTSGASEIKWLSETAPGARLIEIFMPSLRERKEDIALLTTFFLQSLRQTGQSTVRTLAKRALSLLEAYVWPGNVLELRKTVEYAAIRATVMNEEELKPEHLPDHLQRTDATGGTVLGSWDYRTRLAYTELWLANRAIIDRGLDNKTLLAEALGYNDRFVFLRRLRKCMDEFPSISREFPKVILLFKKKTEKRGRKRLKS